MGAPRETLGPTPPDRRSDGARPRRRPLMDDQRLWIGSLVLGLLLLLAVVLQVLRA